MRDAIGGLIKQRVVVTCLAQPFHQVDHGTTLLQENFSYAELRYVRNGPLDWQTTPRSRLAKLRLLLVFQCLMIRI